jgi:manganese transport protein
VPPRLLIPAAASGISSSGVGTMAGQVIMQGFVGFSISVWVRRLVDRCTGFHMKPEPSFP